MTGSMMVFLVLTVTASHTKFWRRTILLLTTLYYFECGQFLSNFCFFSGALLADLSLVLGSSISSTSTTSRYIPYIGLRWKRLVIEYWPITLALFALLLASVPPSDQDYVAYSRTIYFFFEDYITADPGKMPLFKLTHLKARQIEL